MKTLSMTENEIEMNNTERSFWNTKRQNSAAW